MRHGSGFVLLIAFAMLWVTTPQGYAQDAAPDVRYWPLSEITFPVAVERLQTATQRPTKLRFHVAAQGGSWKEVANKGISELDVIDAKSNRRGFSYSSLADGTYDFALQLEYANGQRDPLDADLRPQWRVIFDTKPPVVRVSRLGTTGIEWDVVDDNLKADSIQIEARYLGDPKFSVVTPKNFRPKTRDSYTWVYIPPNDTLEVRIVARDKAGHETVSAPITLPSNGAGAGLGGSSGTGGSGFGNPRDFDAPGNGVHQPQIEFSNTKNLKITSKIQKVTRSGIVSADLWMREERGGWKKVDTKPVNIVQGAPDPKIVMEYAVPEDGRYGFIVIPVNGAGGKEDDPKPNDLAQFLIEVDTLPPVVTMTSARPMPNGATGPRVEITWNAKDKNLAASPIVIEYSDSRTGPNWKPIHIDPSFLPNTGRYVWEVEDKDLWRFFIRVSAVDLAGHRGQDVSKDEVKIDLETPKAFVEKVQANGKPQIREANSSPTVTPTSAPAPAPEPMKLPNIVENSTPRPAPAPIASPAKPEVTLPADPSHPILPTLPPEKAPMSPLNP